MGSSFRLRTLDKGEYCATGEVAVIGSLSEDFCVNVM